MSNVQKLIYIVLTYLLTWFFTDISKPYSSLQMPHVSLHNFQRPKTSLDQQPLISSWFSKTFPPLNFYFDILFCPLVLKVPTGFPGVLKTNVICCFVKTPKMFVFKFLQIRIWIFFCRTQKKLFIKWQRKFINCWNYPRHFKIDDTSGYGSKLIFNRWKFYENT